MPCFPVDCHICVLMDVYVMIPDGDSLLSIWLVSMRQNRCVGDNSSPSVDQYAIKELAVIVPRTWRISSIVLCSSVPMG